MISPLDDPAIVDHQNAIGLHDRAEPMGNDKRRAARQQSFQRTLHEQFGRGVDGACGFVEHEDAGIGKKCSGEADQLPLAERHVAPRSPTSV